MTEVMNDGKLEVRETSVLYALLHIGPTGFNDVELEFVTELPDDADKAYYTGGEGQCLIFKLEKFDMSTPFYNAFLDGRVSQKLSGLRHPVKIIQKKYWVNGKLFGQSYGYENRQHHFIFIDSGGHTDNNISWTEISQEEYMKKETK